MESIQSSREKALSELEELRSKTSASDAQLEEAQATAAGEQACIFVMSLLEAQTMLHH